MYNKLRKKELYIIHFLISKLDTTYEVIKKDPRRVP